MRVKIIREIAVLAAFVFLSILLISDVSAEIMLSQPKTIYSLGDELNLSVSIKESSDSDSFLDVDLVCGDASQNFYKRYVSVKAGEENLFKPRVVLNKEFLGDMFGTCNVRAKYLSEQESSSGFEISSKINLDLDISTLNFYPKEVIIIKGRAIKANSELLDGFVEVKMNELNVTGSVENGKFETQLPLPQDIKTGSYSLRARAYEKDKDNNIINEGTESKTIKIKPVETDLDILLEKQNFMPGKNVSLGVKILDQGGDKMDGEVGISITNPKEENFMKKLIKAGESISFYLEKNSTPGSWKIKAYTTRLNKERIFSVEVNEEADFEISDGTLTIRNVGNVKYERVIEISIGDSVETEPVTLELGQEKKLKITAPDGEYKIVVSDKNKTLTKEGVSLTGRVISVKEIKKSVIKAYPIIWIFLLALFSVSAVLLLRKVYKKKSFAFVGGVSKSSKEEPKKEKGTIEIQPVSQIKEAEHAIVEKGARQESAIVTAKIKNMNEIKDQAAKEVIEKVKKIINENKAVLYLSDNYLTGIFSPLITKTFKNERPAVKLASEIAEMLKEHNRKFEQKIEFGVGVNLGEIIAEKKDNKLRFTSLGNTLPLAKKIADLSDKEVLLSKAVHSRVIPEIKTEKEEKQGTEVYHIKYVAEREKNSRFIQDFLSRQKAESFVK